MAHYFNDGTKDAPKLRVYLNLDNLADLGPRSLFPCALRENAAAWSDRLRADGFEGVQLTDAGPPPAGLSLPYCGLDRISMPAEADETVRRHAARGDQCLTVHAGWGIEDDDEVARLVEAILQAADQHRLPVFVETHRATITQDMWRTVQIIKRFPQLRLNGDFSHYYCGQEMPYGGMDMKLAFMEPILGSIGFIHGRIASSGSMQMPIDPDFMSRPAAAFGHVDYLADFRRMWVAAMAGFQAAAGPGDVLIFAPELLSGAYYYARLFQGSDCRWVEETDRYQQALIYQRLARACWAEAQQKL